MNNARLWLVVKPTVGLPLLLGAVAVSSFAVHLAVLSKVTWYEDYLAGEELGSGAASASLDGAVKVASATGETPRVATRPASATAPGKDLPERVLIVMPDGRTAEAVLEPPVTLASSAVRE